MRSSLMWLLGGCMVASVAVVQMRQESRMLYAQLQRLQQERDTLNVQWGRLLLEEGAWSQHLRIETIARRQLAMEPPSAQQIRVLSLEGNR